MPNGNDTATRVVAFIEKAQIGLSFWISSVLSSKDQEIANSMYNQMCQLKECGGLMELDEADVETLLRHCLEGRSVDDFWSYLREKYKLNDVFDHAKYEALTSKSSRRVKP